MNGKLAGVTGWPVAQSLSPAIHDYWLRKHRVAGAYVALPIEPENFERCVSALPLMGFAGVNVTVPHKAAAAALAGSLDDDATATGAVNLLVFSNGKILGRNTDVQGFANSLDESFPVPALTDRPAVVVGAGGAARAVVLALARAGFRQIRIVNRTAERSEELARKFGNGNIRVSPWGDWATAFSDAGLLVNTTSLGMKGKPPLDLPIQHLPSSAAVADIVYNPIRTSLLKSAEQAGHPIMDGLGMLMHQAVPAFEVWFGVRPAVTEELRAELLKELLRA
jgi:shikimate dehydrogenase